MTQKQHYKEILSHLDIDIPEIKTIAEPTALVLSYFSSDLGTKNLSVKTLKQHRDNIYYIAHFNSHYDVDDKFDLKYFMDGPHNEYRFSYKVSDSKYAINSFLATWRKLTKYIKTNFEQLQEEINKIPESGS